MTDDPAEDHEKEKLKHSTRRQTRFRKVRRVFKNIPWVKDEIDAAKVADHPQNCDCFMCKNPRRVWKGKWRITRQEQRAKQKERDAD